MPNSKAAGWGFKNLDKAGPFPVPKSKSMEQGRQGNQESLAPTISKYNYSENTTGLTSSNSSSFSGSIRIFAISKEGEWKSFAENHSSQILKKQRRFREGMLMQRQSGYVSRQIHWKRGRKTAQMFFHPIPTVISVIGKQKWSHFWPLLALGLGMKSGCRDRNRHGPQTGAF